MTFTFKPLSGLPPYGEPALGFSPSGKGLHSEGFVVEFTVGENSWVGNFIRDESGFDLATRHPNGQHAIVIAGGLAYVIDPVNKQLLHCLSDYIVYAFFYPQRQWLIINDWNTFFWALGPEGEVWRSRRIAWDEMRSIQVKDNILTGESSDLGDDQWVPFSLNLDNGAVEGGAYYPVTEEATPNFIWMPSLLSFVRKIGAYWKRLSGAGR